jgi:hypothetical protein
MKKEKEAVMTTCRNTCHPLTILVRPDSVHLELLLLLFMLSMLGCGPLSPN